MKAKHTRLIVASFGAAIAATLGGLGGIAAGAVDETILISRTDGLGANGGDESSFEAVASADGRFVAFSSQADNLSSDHNGAYNNVFVRDTQANTTTLVSRQSGTAPDNGADGHSFGASISADGRYVAFQSQADNLSDDDTPGYGDVFVRDLQSNTTTLVSRESGTDPMNGGDDSSTDPSISADGLLVAFQSDADNLSDADNASSTGDVFVRDLQANTTMLVSRTDGLGMNGGDFPSSAPSISADGRFVAFESHADNLSSDHNDAYLNVFVRDLQANTTTLVSRQSGTAPDNGADDQAFGPSISADGRYVAFQSPADNLSSDHNAAYTNVFVRDTQANVTILASRQSGTAAMNGANFNAYDPSISGDGRYVAFQSGAANLSTDDSDPSFDIFVRDIQANDTILISRQSGTAAMNGADGDSYVPSISADGRFVVFFSDADNLSTEDDNAYSNVFMRQFRELPPGPPPPPPSARCLGKTATKVGTARRDVINGTARRDVIAGLGGNDVIRGLGGNDLICGGAGRDKLVGGKGKDQLLGGAGRDGLLGGGGKDKLLGQAGADTLLGGAGKDRLLGGAGRDTLRGGAGVDKLLGGAGKDVQKQ